MKYAYIDGDNIGLSIEKCFMENDEENLIRINEEVNSMVQKISAFLVRQGNSIIFSGADGIICKGMDLDLKELLNFIRSSTKNFTFSIGGGKSLNEAFLALRYAKANNKNVAVELIMGKFVIMGHQHA